MRAGDERPALDPRVPQGLLNPEAAHADPGRDAGTSEIDATASPARNRSVHVNATGNTSSPGARRCPRALPVLRHRPRGMRGGPASPERTGAARAPAATAERGARAARGQLGDSRAPERGRAGRRGRPKGHARMARDMGGALRRQERQRRDASQRSRTPRARRHDGKQVTGPGTVTLTIEPSGELKGTAKGALGDATLVGKVEDGIVRASVFPDGIRARPTR